MAWAWLGYAWGYEKKREGGLGWVQASSEVVEFGEIGMIARAE